MIAARAEQAKGLAKAHTLLLNSGAMRRLLPFLSLVLLSAPLAAKDSLGVFDDWGAFSDLEVPRCYAIAAAEGGSGAYCGFTLNAASRAAREAGLKMVQLSGPSTQIKPHYDPGLAAPRIQLVEDELVADGIPREKIVRTSLPTDDVQVNTSGAQRVEIRVLK